MEEGRTLTPEEQVAAKQHLEWYEESVRERQLAHQEEVERRAKAKRQG